MALTASEPAAYECLDLKSIPLSQQPPLPSAGAAPLPSALLACDTAALLAPAPLKSLCDIPDASPSAPATAVAGGRAAATELFLARALPSLCAHPSLAPYAHTGVSRPSFAPPNFVPAPGLELLSDPRRIRSHAYNALYTLSTLSTLSSLASSSSCAKSDALSAVAPDASLVAAQSAFIGPPCPPALAPVPAVPARTPAAALAVAVAAAVARAAGTSRSDAAGLSWLTPERRLAVAAHPDTALLPYVLGCPVCGDDDDDYDDDDDQCNGDRILPHTHAADKKCRTCGHDARGHSGDSGDGNSVWTGDCDRGQVTDRYCDETPFPPVSGLGQSSVPANTPNDAENFALPNTDEPKTAKPKGAKTKADKKKADQIKADNLKAEKLKAAEFAACTELSAAAHRAIAPSVADAAASMAQPLCTATISRATVECGPSTASTRTVVLPVADVAALSDGAAAAAVQSVTGEFYRYLCLSSAAGFLDAEAKARVKDTRGGASAGADGCPAPDAAFAHRRAEAALEAAFAASLPLPVPVDERATKAIARAVADARNKLFDSSASGSNARGSHTRNANGAAGDSTPALTSIRELMESEELAARGVPESAAKACAAAALALTAAESDSVVSGPHALAYRPVPSDPESADDGDESIPQRDSKPKQLSEEQKRHKRLRLFNERSSRALVSFGTAMAQPLFLALSRSALRRFLVCDELNCGSEFALFQAVVRWGRFRLRAYGLDDTDPALVRLELHDLLPLIRFGAMTAAELAAVTQGMPLPEGFDCELAAHANASCNTAMATSSDALPANNCAIATKNPANQHCRGRTMRASSLPKTSAKNSLSPEDQSSTDEETEKITLPKPTVLQCTMIAARDAWSRVTTAAHFGAYATYRLVREMHAFSRPRVLTRGPPGAPLPAQTHLARFCAARAAVTAASRAARDNESVALSLFTAAETRALRRLVAHREGGWAPLDPTAAAAAYTREQRALRRKPMQKQKQS